MEKIYYEDLPCIVKNYLLGFSHGKSSSPENFTTPEEFELPDVVGCVLSTRLKDGDMVPSGYVKIAMEHGPITVDVPIKNGDFL